MRANLPRVLTRPAAFLAPLFLLIGCVTAAPDLERDVDRVLTANRGRTIAVAYYDLRDGTSLLRNERERFHAASTMKVPVMLAIFEAVSRGELRLDQPVRVRNEFVSILDGSTYALEAREDSDPKLYELIGQELPLQELVRRMIVRSSNLSTNIVIDLIGAKRVMELMKQIGAHDTQVLRGVEDDKAYHAGMNNTTTAYDMMLIFRALEPSRKLVDVLAGQEHRKGIPAGVPPGIRVANKTGSITAISHDAALVFTPDGGSYVLVVLTRGFKKEKASQKAIAAISKAVWRSKGIRPNGESSIRR